jgi:predicted transcriptional regulator
MASELSSRDKILELNNRKKIYTLVKKFAGCHFRDLERKSELPTATIRYHLSYLSKHNLIQGKKEGNYLRYFPTEFKQENKILLSLLRQKKVRDIILFILVNPNCNHKQIAEAVEVSPSTVSWHLKKLIDKNVVGFINDGRETFYNLLIDKSEIIKLLITYQESFLDSLVDRVIEMWE